MAATIGLTLDCANALALTEAGATTLWEEHGHHVTMADPEGNEFCVC